MASPMSIVYIFTNPAFDYIKIGRTQNVTKRLKDLDKTNIPLPYRCVYAARVEHAEKVEANLHKAFEDRRVRTNREFFDVSPEQAMAALKIANGEDVTPHKDIAADDEGINALNRVTERRSSLNLFRIGLSIGDMVSYVNDETVTAEVIGERKIKFEENETSLSAAALTLLQRDGFEWKTANGSIYWRFEGETLAERRNRLENHEE